MTILGIMPTINVIVILFAIIFLLSLLRKSKEEYHSNWAHLLPGFQFSSKEFYELVRKEMVSHEIVGLTFEKLNLRIGSIVSTRRVYLRIQWNEYYYDLCFAPFGDGCFVSWWLIYKTSPKEELISKFPFIGNWLQRAFFRKTFYKIDTASMFMTYAHQSVLKVVDDITKGTAIRISEDERKPKLNDIFKR